METENLKISTELSQRRGAILELVDQLGTQKALADAIGMKEARISKALSNQWVSDRRLAPIERAIDKWKETTSFTNNHTIAEPPPAYGSGRSTEQQQDGSVLLTIYDVTGGGGSVGGVVIREHPVGSYPIALVEVEALYLHRPERPFVIDMIGESMEPDFTSGDRIIIEPYPKGSRTIQGSAIYLFRLDDLIEVKQLQYLPGGVIQISAKNRDYPIREIRVEGVDFEVIGRVWGKFKRY